MCCTANLNKIINTSKILLSLLTQIADGVVLVFNSHSTVILAIYYQSKDNKKERLELSEQFLTICRLLH